MLSALWILVLSFGVSAAAPCESYECYKPGVQVKRWQDNEFDSDMDYVMKLVNRVIPFVVVAFLLILVLLCW